MSEDDDSTSPEPEELALWRALAELRTHLVQEVRTWSAEEHPIREMDRVASALAELPLSDCTDGDAMAAHHAQLAQKRIAELDTWIQSTGRRETEERGRTLAQLRAKVVELRQHGAKAKAEQAIRDWLAARDDTEKRQRAADAAWRVYSGHSQSHPIGNEDGRVASLLAAEEADRKERLGESMERRRRAGRILGRLLEQ